MVLTQSVSEPSSPRHEDSMLQKNGGFIKSCSDIPEDAKVSCFISVF